MPEVAAEAVVIATTAEAEEVTTTADTATVETITRSPRLLLTHRRKAPQVMPRIHMHSVS